MDYYVEMNQTYFVRKDDRLAYLIGALADGSIYHNKKHYVYRVTYYQKSLKYLKESIEPLVSKIFDKTGSIYHDKRKDVYFYEIASKEVYHCMLEASEDFKSKETRRVPEWIRGGSHTVRTAFIRGFFDTDGSYCVNYDKYDYRVRFGQIDKQVILDVREILQGLRFKVSELLGPYQYKKDARPYYEIQLHGKHQFLRFSKIIKPRHPEKQLDDLISWK